MKLFALPTVAKIAGSVLMLGLFALPLIADACTITTDSSWTDAQGRVHTKHTVENFPGPC